MSVLGRLVRRVLPRTLLMRWLCRVDNAVYRAMSLAAVGYDGGLHVKHRLTRYHDFFVERVAPGARVLDVGCGPGALAADLARGRDARVTGVDFDAAAIAAARRRFDDPRLTFRVGDARALDDEHFDVVILSNVLEHLDDRIDFLRDITARTGARHVLIRVPLFERDWRVPLKRELGIEHRLDPTHRIEYTLDEFEDEVAKAGLALTERQVRWGEIWATCQRGP